MPSPKTCSGFDDASLLHAITHNYKQNCVAAQIIKFHSHSYDFILKMLIRAKIWLDANLFHAITCNYVVKSCCLALYISLGPKIIKCYAQNNNQGQNMD